MNVSFEDYKIGGKDRFGHDIKYIHSFEENYVIYESDDFVLHYDEKGGGQATKNMASLGFKMAIINILRGEGASRKGNTQIALAWNQCFEGDLENSKKILDTIISNLLIKGKITYIISAFFAVLLTFIIVILINKVHDDFFLPAAITLPNICLLGALGGLISILIKLKNLYLDPHSRVLNAISGISRILISITSALLFYLAYKSQLILAVFDSIEPEEEMFFVMACSIIVGFIERFIPEIANQVSNLIKKEGSTSKN